MQILDIGIAQFFCLFEWMPSIGRKVVNLRQILPHVKRSLTIGIQIGLTQPVKVDINKKLDSKQKNIQIFNIDAQGLRKTKNENPPTREIRATS